jgi:hypothetical protein
MGTILTALVLLAIVAMIILKMRRDRKKNRCAGCPYAGYGALRCGEKHETL